MKKLVYFCAIALAVSVFSYSCSKTELTEEEVSGKEQNIENTGDNLKAANTTSCSTSCFWSSCSVTCNDNVGVAACACVNVLGVGFLGSTAVCACGGIGVTSSVSKVDFDDDHIDRYNILIKIISDSGLNSERLTSLKDVAEKIVKHGSKNGNAFGKKRVLLDEFIESANNLEKQEAKYIGIELRKHPECSSLTPIKELDY